MARATRAVTNRLLELMEEGALDPRTVAGACLSYLSEFVVADTARSNELRLRLLEMMDDGTLDPRTITDACLSYLSESDVADMASSNELLPEGEETEEE